MNPVELPHETLANAFYGKEEEPKEPGKEEQVTEEEESDVQAAAEEEAEVQSEEDDQDLDAKAQDETDEEQEEDESDDEEGPQPVQTVDELIEHLQTDPEWFMNLKFKETVRGKEVETTLDEMRQAFRMGNASESYLEEAKEKSRAMLEEAQHIRQEAEAQAAVFASMVTGLEQQLEADIRGADLSTLRREDPAEYAAKKDEFKERREAIQTMKNQAVQGYYQNLQKSQQQLQEARQKNLPEEQKILHQKLPEWKNPKVVEKEQPQFVNWMYSEGFSEQDIEAISWNGNALSLAVKAWKYDTLGKKSDVAKKKIRSIPKVLKGGTKAEKANPKRQPKNAIEALYGSD